MTVAAVKWKEVGNFKSYLVIKIDKTWDGLEMGGVREREMLKISRFVALPLNRHRCFSPEPWKNSRLCGAEFGQAESYRDSTYQRKVWRQKCKGGVISVGMATESVAESPHRDNGSPAKPY